MENIVYRNGDGEIQIQLESIEDSGWFRRERCYSFSILHQGIYVGYVDYRSGPYEIMYYAGNIGYRINFQHRGHHYALKATRLLLEFLMEYELACSVFITCSPDNIPSRKTIEKLSARFLEEVDVPRKHWLYKRGEKRKLIYEINLV
ncbi:GNAT family N-acetyltransferase [Bulleidia sp. zg-1006]|uniref:GNAT family N-acetyltransferase n=1 Tax=Bulleidia sp. zg-1006 TaxID=2806552 RepID=UPI001939CA6F|nr:GNAT family N-acetyltransferase [Bulleidia sp. zg-1006]QRG86463.1 GNAT family N-acetyltransferase [Bulleidia sp. zg-1006]